MVWPGINSCRAEGNVLGLPLKENKRPLFPLAVLLCCLQTPQDFPAPWWGGQTAALYTQDAHIGFFSLQQLRKDSLQTHTLHKIIPVLSPSPRNQYSQHYFACLCFPMQNQKCWVCLRASSRSPTANLCTAGTPLWLMISLQLIQQNQPLASLCACKWSFENQLGPAVPCLLSWRDRKSQANTHRQHRAAATCHHSCVYPACWVAPNQDAASLQAVTLLQLIASPSQRNFQLNKNWTSAVWFAAACEKHGCRTQAVSCHPPLSSCLSWSLCILLRLLL